MTDAHRHDLPDARAQLRDAVVLWFAAWFIGQMISAVVVVAGGIHNLELAGPGWLFLVALAGWAPLVGALLVAGRRVGVLDWRRVPGAFGLSFRRIDLLGVPLGVLVQVAVLPLLYWPLRSLWPDTFNDDKVQQRARDLWQHAHGAGVVLLVFVVVIGAPVVEELVYRGLLQGALERRLAAGTLASRLEPVGLVAVWFAVIHFQPVETPGLFVVGLAFGLARWFTKRLGMGVCAHMAFNATGLVMVAFAR